MKNFIDTRPRNYLREGEVYATTLMARANQKGWLPEEDLETVERIDKMVRKDKDISAKVRAAFIGGFCDGLKDSLKVVGFATAFRGFIAYDEKHLIPGVAMEGIKLFSRSLLPK